MMAVKMPTSLGSMARSRATAGIMTLSDRTESEIITWMASILATGTIARFIAADAKEPPHAEEPCEARRLEAWAADKVRGPTKPRRLLRGNRDGRCASSSG